MVIRFKYIYIYIHIAQVHLHSFLSKIAIWDVDDRILERNEFSARFHDKISVEASFSGIYVCRLFARCPCRISLRCFRQDLARGSSGKRLSQENLAPAIALTTP